MRQTSTMKPRQKMQGHTNWVQDVVHLPGRYRIITCSHDGSLRLWDLESGTQIGDDWRVDRGEINVETIALSPNGKTVAAGNYDGTVRLWDVETGKVVVNWTGHTRIVYSLCWRADGQRVVSGSSDGTARVWDVKSGKAVLEPIMTGHQEVYAVKYSPDTTKIATGGREEDGVKIWDVKTGKLLFTIEHRYGVWSLAWTSDQKKLISGSYDASIRLFDTATWKQIAVLNGHKHVVRAISLFGSDRLLASASRDQTVRLWNLDTNLQVGPSLQHEEQVNGIAISADGKLLVTPCFDHDVYLWDIYTILQDIGLEDLLFISDVAARKSLMDSDVTRLLAQLPPQLPRGFFDDAPDGIHSSTTHAGSSAQHHRLTLASRSHTILARFSSVFHRSQPIINNSMELQPASRRRSFSSRQNFPPAEVAPVRDRQALYVARRPEQVSDKVKRIKNPTWLTRCILFVCCVSVPATNGDR